LAFVITFGCGSLVNGLLGFLYPELIPDIPLLATAYQFVIWFQLLPQQDIGSWVLGLYTRDAVSQEILPFPRMLLCLILWNVIMTNFNMPASWEKYYMGIYGISVISFLYVGQPLHNLLTNSAVYVCDPSLPISTLPLQYIAAYGAYYFLAPIVSEFMNNK